MEDQGQMEIAEVAMRLGAATLLGLIVGFNREVHGKAAGLRTHTLTALSGAALTLVGFEIYHDLLDREGSNAEADPIRVIQGLAQAIGLICAGIVIQGHGNRIRNLTTAVTLWLAAALGIACGAGFYIIAGMTTVLTLVILWLGEFVEERLFADREEAEAEKPADES